MRGARLPKGGKADSITDVEDYTTLISVRCKQINGYKQEKTFIKSKLEAFRHLFVSIETVFSF